MKISEQAQLHVGYNLW